MKVRLGDGLAGLASTKANSAQLLLSDLPSGETRAAFDVRPNLEAFWAAAWHSVGDRGAVVVLASSLLFAMDLVDSQRRWFRYDLIWEKSLATGFLNAHHRPLRAHEFILMFSKHGKPTYNPQRRDGEPPIHSAARRYGHGENYGRHTRPTFARHGATDRFPRSVVRAPSVGTTSKLRKHPQQKPEALLRGLILTYSNPGDLVVDPFAGSGSTGRAAEHEGRRFLGWDTDPRFGQAGAGEDDWT